ncbi:ATP-binding protein [soil metagenome]
MCRAAQLGSVRFFKFPNPENRLHPPPKNPDLQNVPRPTATPKIDPGEAALAIIAKLEKELTETRRLAELGILAAGLAHEFNNILAPVAVSAELALARPEDSHLTERSLRRIAAAGRRGTELAACILELAAAAKISGEKDEVQDVPRGTIGFCLGGRVDIARVIGEEVDVLRGTALGVDIRIDAFEKIWVSGSEISYRRVVANLIQNAVRAAGRMGRVDVTTRIRGGVVTVLVRDSGRGIAEGVVERLFEFGMTGWGGHGVGLALCRRLVERGGGRIWGANVVDVGGRVVGAEFGFELPGGVMEVGGVGGPAAAA